jgi:DNA-directed RNA polymerase specialized sigma24 family protein
MKKKSLIDHYAGEVLTIAKRRSGKFATNDFDRDEIASLVSYQFCRHPERYMERYATPIEFVSAVIGTRFQDFLRFERQGRRLIDDDVDGRVLEYRHIQFDHLFWDENFDEAEFGVVIDFFLADHIDIEEALCVLTDDERHAFLGMKELRKTAKELSDERGVVHTTILHRVKVASRKLKNVLGENYLTEH